jgi:cytochrome P450
MPACSRPPGLTVQATSSGLFSAVSAALATPLYCPPRPHPLSAVAALGRAILNRDGDLLSLLPAEAYAVPVGPLGYSRRSILIVNDPELARGVLTDPTDIYPKNDLMVGALAPLVGESIFVSSGPVWRRQRRMVDPAFTHMRIARAFTAMVAALDDFEQHLDAVAARGETISLDLAMSHLTADIICRTVFSTSLESQVAKKVFEAFTLFEKSVAHVEIARLILAKPWSAIPQKPHVLAACELIRRHLGTLVDAHMAAGAARDDIASAIIAAREPDTGEGFTREELIDQLGVFFLAGHETTASVLTWAFFMAATQPAITARVRDEVARVAGDGAVEADHVRQLAHVRNVFKEALRLYPPITFIPRVAAEATRIGPYRVRRGAMIMISPWTIHRNGAYWPNPHAFDPDRFTPEREQETPAGAYLPFGLGPRVCVGAGFATVEATLILARLLRRYDLTALAPERVRPVARLTTRPAEQIMLRVARRA